MGRQFHSIFTLTATASGTISAHRFVANDSSQAGNAANTMGVARTDAADGEALPVDMLGTAIVEAGAVIAAGAAVQTDANGRAITKAAGPTVARLMPGESAGAVGDLIEVILIPN